MFRLVIVTIVLGFASAAVQRMQPRLPDQRIVGGVETTIQDHPYQLSFQRFGSHICGASVVSGNWAITAGHCVGGSTEYYTVTAGNSDKYKGTTYKIKRVIRHPKYSGSTIDYDIALLEIDGEIEFNEGVQPVDLPEVEVAAGTTVNITGWGAIRQGGGVSKELMRVSIPIVTREVCQDAYKYMNTITQRMICAGRVAEGGQDSCQGDSGGPLVANNVLYGVVSWGYGCAVPQYPGVYTNVAELRDWIKENSDL